MENLQIGKWLITNDGIEWTGVPFTGYYINKELLLKKSHDHKDASDWLLHLAYKNWLTEQDIYALNTAFMAAIERFVPAYKQAKVSLAKTLDEQQKIIHYKNALPNKGMVWQKLLDSLAGREL